MIYILQAIAYESEEDFQDDEFADIKTFQVPHSIHESVIEELENLLHSSEVLN